MCYYTDINCSRSLAIYNSQLDDYGTQPLKIGGHSKVQTFSGTMPMVFLDIVQYIKEDFRSSQINMPKTKKNETIKNKWHFLFSNANSAFVPFTFILFIQERTIDPLKNNKMNHNLGFLEQLERPHLFSYLVFLDNILLHDSSIREKIYKFFLEEYDIVKTTEYFNWQYYIMYNQYQFVLNKPFQDTEWGLMFSRFLIVSGLFINFCKINHLRFKCQMKQIVPYYGKEEPNYFNPNNYCLPILLYSNFFLEFVKSSQIDSNSVDELIESDYPQRLIVVSRAIEMITEFCTGPCEENQNLMNQENLLPIVHIVMRNMKEINSIYYILQKAMLDLIGALLEGKNPISISLIETIVDPHLLIDTMFSHFKKLFIYTVIMSPKYSNQKWIIFKEYENAYHDMQKSVKHGLWKELDFSSSQQTVKRPEKILWVKLDDDEEYFRPPSPKLKKKVVEEEETDPYYVQFPERRKKPDPISPIVKAAIACIEKGEIPLLLEKCQSKAMKLKNQAQIWETHPPFCEHPFYKLSTKYFEILQSPGEKGAKFSYFLDAQRKRIIKTIGGEFDELKSKEFWKDFDPTYTIRVYFDIKKIEIEVVDQSKSHQILTFFLHPKSKFISDQTKSQFEKDSPLSECSTKMLYLINNVKYFAIESDNNYYWKTHNVFIYNWNDIKVYRLGLLILFGISCTINLLILLNYIKDPVTKKLIGKYPLLNTAITILTFAEALSSLIQCISWFIFRYNESILISKFKRVGAIQSDSGDEKNLDSKNFSDFYNDYIDSFAKIRIVQNLIIHFTFSLFGYLYSKVFYSLKLLTIFNISDIAQFVLLTVTHGMKDMIMAFGIAMMVIWNFVILLSTFFSEQFDDVALRGQAPCSNLLECYLDVLDLGLRNGGGLGDSQKYMKWEEKGYFSRWLLDVLFFVIVNIICINIIFSIIIDTFGQFRDINRKYCNFIFLFIFKIINQLMTKRTFVMYAG